MRTRIAIDIGGTFTDVVVHDETNDSLHSAKTLSEPEDLIRGIRAILTSMAKGVSDVDLAIHGSTVVINALIERRGARTALVTTSGFRDVYEIGRINRPDSFNLDFERHQPLVPRHLIYEIPERLAADGEVIQSVNMAAVERVAEELSRRDIESVAVVLLHAYRNPEHELIVGDIVRRYLPDAYVTLSHEISREYREFERTSTTVANAFVGPIVTRYLDRLQQLTDQLPGAPTLSIMQSSGGLMDTATARRQCVQMMESGPAGGVVGVINTGSVLNIPNAIAFDMGGTTSKAAVIRGLRFPQADDYFIGGYNSGLPIRIPTLDIVEIGTGGGSIAWVDDALGFHVGPISAGATPRQACYDRGGDRPTVTDAALVLGLLPHDGVFGNGSRLDLDQAVQALGPLCKVLSVTLPELAAGILTVATSSMANAVRAVTSSRGLDPRDFALFAYGGNGPMVGSAVAAELGIETVIVPPHPAVFSAFGMLGADLRSDLVQTNVRPLAELDPERFQEDIASLEEECAKSLILTGRNSADIYFERAADMRYVGQEHTVSVPLPATLTEPGTLAIIKSAFDAAHQERFAHSAPREPAEVVSLRVSAIGRLDAPSLPKLIAGTARPNAKARLADRFVTFDATSGPVPSAVWSRAALRARNKLSGPALIEEGTATTVLRNGDVAVIDELGNIHIRVGGQS